MFYLDPNKLKATQRQQATTQDWPLRFAQLAKTAKNSALQAFYNAGVISGDTPLSEVPLLAIDIETTGLNPKKDGILSLGAVPMSLARIRCKDAQHWFVKPRLKVDSSSMVIHGITHSQIATAPDLEAVIESILKLFAGKILVVHCNSIERLFLDAAFKTRLNEGLEFPVIDTMELESRLHRKKPLSWWDKLRGRQLTSIRLAAARQRYGLPNYHPHDALTDALASAELLQAQIAHHYTPQTLLNHLWK